MTTLAAPLLAEGDPPSKLEILRCALRLFVRDGLCETSIRDIAQASGYTNPALYKFFESKEALALHLFERCYQQLVGAVRASQRRGSGFEANLDSLLAAYAGLVDENLESVLYVSDTLRLFWLRLPADARRRSLLSEIRRLLKRGVAEGAIRPDTDLDLAMATVVGGMAQVARMAYFGELERPIGKRLAGLRTLLGRALSRSGR